MMRLYGFQKTAFRFLPLMLACWILLSFSSLSVIFAQDEETSSSESSAASEAEDHTFVNFVDADITAVIKYMSQLAGKAFIIDGNVKGKVNVISPEKISKEEAYRLCESVMDVNGFALVPSTSGNYITVLPVSEARTKNIDTQVEKSQAVSGKKEPGDVLVTRLIPLKYADAKEVKSLFTPLVSKNSVIMSYPDTNTLIVTDSESNIKRLRRIINTIDVPGTGREISTIQLTYADAETISKQLTTIFSQPISEEKDTSQKALQFVADERTNTIIFVASEDDTARIEKFIDDLDKETPVGKGKIHVYKLKNAEAENIAETLQNLQKGTSTSSEAGKEAVFVSSDITIAPDEASNSLVIMCDNADYATIEEIIIKLDLPKPMVYIQALIMEISVDKSLELGVEWSVFNDTTYNGDTAYVGAGFNNSEGFTNAAGNLLYSSGGTTGIISGDLDISVAGQTITVPNLGALIKALQSNKDIHILQTPTLIAYDNVESSIVVGETVPVKTQESTSATNSEVINSSIDYKTVGHTLKITPHISDDRIVRLEIYEQLSALSDTSTEITTTPTTMDRTLTTVVVMKDQSTLVLGGLIDDSYTNTVVKVPLLGSIPILGRLFRYDTQIGAKTNLYIFITPRVIENPADATRLTEDFKKTLSPKETDIIKRYGPLESSESDTEPYTTEQPSE